MDETLLQLLGSLAPSPEWGARYGVNQGQKGNGYFGPLLRPDGGLSSELSFDFDHGGKQVSAPLLVPTLNKVQIDHLLSGGDPTDEIYRAAQNYAISRMQRGRPTFALPNEVYALPTK